MKTATEEPTMTAIVAYFERCYERVSDWNQVKLIEDQNFDRSFQLNDVQTGDYIGSFATRQDVTDFCGHYGLQIVEG